MPCTNSRVPSSGSTTQTRRFLQPDRIVHALFGKPAFAIAQQFLAQHGVQSAVGFGHGVVPGLVFRLNRPGSEAREDCARRLQRGLNAWQNFGVEAVTNS